MDRKLRYNITMFKLTKKAFKEWLKSKDKDELVAIEHYDANSCPIANFMMEKLELSHRYDISVSGECIFIFGIGTKSPLWVTKFVKYVDEYSLDDKRIFLDKPIPVSVALKGLR